MPRPPALYSPPIAGQWPGHLRATKSRPTKFSAACATTPSSPRLPIQRVTEDTLQYTPSPVPAPLNASRLAWRHHRAQRRSKTPPPDPFARMRQSDQMPRRPTSAGQWSTDLHHDRFIPTSRPTATPTPPTTCRLYELWPAGVLKTPALRAKTADVSRQLSSTSPARHRPHTRPLQLDMSTGDRRDSQPTPSATTPGARQQLGDRLQLVAQRPARSSSPIAFRNLISQESPCSPTATPER
jgi:hypothetical protein